jgi:lysophospholipase L1-like esterase
MHGWDYTEDEYRKAYPRAIEAIQKYAPGAIIVIASTTPTDSADTKSTANPQTDRIVVRNQAAAAVAAANHFPVDDVFTTAYGHPECFDSGGIHFNPTGIGVLAARVTASITPMLAKQ